MTFGSAWALAGLVLLAPLIALHLRNRGRPVREVPSLVLWQELELTPVPGERGLRLPPLPLLLLLQAAAIVLIVLALAQPRGAAKTPAPAQVVVLDDSLWMSAPGRLARAERAIERIAASAPSGEAVRIVVSDGAPRVLYRGSAAGVAAALANVRSSAAPADLGDALTIAAGLLGGFQDRITLIRAAEDPVPTHTAAGGELRAVTIGSAIAEQGIYDANARCGVGATNVCEVYATVANSGARPVDVAYSAQASGHAALALHVRVKAGATAPIVLAATPGEEVALRLKTTDALAGDDAAWVTVPGEDDLPSSATVTLVGTPTDATELARALASVPGVSLHLVTPASYRPSDARESELVVLDDWVPKGALPPAPAVLLVDPPHVAGGRVGGPLSDVALSGTDAGSALLEGVDLASLEIDPGAARQIRLPRWIAPVAWSPAGPLLAAGDNGHQRVGVVSFAPEQSDLSQLASFPVLAANFVRWAADWTPGSASAGVPIALDATPGARVASLSGSAGTIERVRLSGEPVALVAPNPGLYTISETGPRLIRRATVAVAAAAASSSSTPVDLRSARISSGAAPRSSIAAWFLAAALAVLVLEWLYWSSRRRRGMS